MKALLSRIVRTGEFRTGLLAFAVLSLIAATAHAAPPAASNPLEPLRKAEIESAVEILKASGKLADGDRFSLVALNEPPKEEVLSYKPGASFRREAFVVLYNAGLNRTAQAVVDLNAGKLASWREVPEAQARIDAVDQIEASKIAHADSGWQAAIRKRGIQDPENIQVDAWSAGYFNVAEEQGKRLVRGFSYYRGKTHNAYSRPIEGLIAIINLNTKKVDKLIDTGFTLVPTENGDFDEKSVGKLRQATAPLEIVQPRGAGFELKGNEVSWQKWRFRFGITPREGLVLYTVTYDDQGRARSVLYRAALSEMVVPYGDPSPGWYVKNAFDEGEYGVGALVDSLEPGNDYPSNATLIDAALAEGDGSVRVVPRAIAIYERDGGILWKHVDYITGHNESRRARQLVVSSVSTVGNYEYGFNWIFNQDGALEMNLDLTGIMQAKGVETDGADSGGHADAYGHRVGPNTIAVNHQHFLNFRLDMDVDGRENSVVELNTQADQPGSDNPYANSFRMSETPLTHEQEARRQLDLASGRQWKIINPSVKNALGAPVGYILIPGENALPYAAPESWVRKRAGFLDAPLWVTQYQPEEMNAAGYYINQSKGGEGLAKWASADRPLQARDVVVWYTVGITHIGRPEEWPVMPSHHAGFRLIPGGFFARNPALDVPKERVAEPKPQPQPQSPAPAGASG